MNLSKVRYNQLQYNRRDIEETIAIPARDRLIVATYLDHVPGRKAVAFAVNVRHGEDLAEAFRRAGVPAASVSGRMANRDREQHLRAFADGRLNRSAILMERHTEHESRSPGNWRSAVLHRL